MDKRLIVCVSALIQNDADETLLIKRAPHDTFPNVWELPGGKVEFGEDPSTALAREIYEETGMNLFATHPVNVKSQMSDDGSKQIIRIIYKCIPLVDESIYLSPDHTDFRWEKEYKA